MTHRLAAGTLVLAGALALAGCHSVGTNAANDNPAISPVSTPAPMTPSTPAPSSAPSSAPPSTAPGSTSVAPSSTSPAPATTTAAPRSTCTKVSVRILPGGAAPGQEIAALQFTNDGTTSCQLVGYPTVTLLRSGKTIGSPSQPATSATSERTLAPGDVAESLLHNYTGSCQAPLSDTVRVVVPGSTISGQRPMQLRACVVRVDKLGAPD